MTFYLDFFATFPAEHEPRFRPVLDSLLTLGLPFTSINPMIGQTVSHYRIVERLGGGGMGVVYKAEDIKLRRAVALKFLSEDLSIDLTTLERFEREAQAASALNHPNICTIYDIDEHQGRRFIAMELLEGRTLKERLLDRRLPVGEVISLAIQVVDGLEAAHAKGIVHRDIKPANIFVSDQGRVKILDFGLAKVVEEKRVPASGAAYTMTAEEPLTGPGSAVGTVAYMSPEQARGEPLDARTDLFSFGLVLYEMATGQQAFKGTTSALIFDAILNKAPTSPVRLNPDLPSELEWIINKALEKDRKLRYQSAGDIRVDLERLKRDSTSARVAAAEDRLSAESVPAPARPGRSRRIFRAATAVTVIAAGVIATALLIGRKRTPEAVLPRVSNTLKVTTAIGVEDYPSWSPDGLMLAYESDQAGNPDIWVTQVGSTYAVNRTEDSPADDFAPTWSPDGQWIAFFSMREGGGYFLMPGVGGKPRKIASWPAGEVYPNPAAWSPDSSQVVYVHGQRVEPWLEILALAKGTSRKLPLPVLPRSGSIMEIAWSPDGRWLAYVRSISPIAATSDLWLTSTSDGASIQLTDSKKRDRSPTWGADARELYFVSDRSGISDLWSLTIGEDGRPGGVPRQVTTGVEMTRATLSRDGKKLAYTKGRTVRNAFRAPILEGRPITWADTTQLTSEDAEIESVDVSPDDRLLVSSDRSGNWDVYVLPAGGGEMQPLTTDPALDAGPRWSPDGREVVFYSNRTGHREVWVMPIGVGPARQLTSGEAESFYPCWSPDGSEVVKEGDRGLAIVPAQGGQERQLTDDARDVHPDWSPDRRWVAFDSVRDGLRRLWRVPASGGQAEPLTRGAAHFPRWSTDGRDIYFIGSGDRLNNIWTLSLDSRREQPVTAFSGRRGALGILGLDVDEEFIYFTWEESRGDLWVADIVTSAGN